ncbi:cytochrome c oxidase assembly protein [Falsirhodobacter sp. 20TX0035]|uniref:cytochrome c oxidase assembly protein n=1 Tax=Falsirhodobacter sp. 20TX0035 TaxID=3022019 RepID=UPI00232BBD35|nr:cytochrome c oxidase assembly protein [Falsirhodobacter sp. 20TX0035]MDB6453707.1 cytochrome c oxidase assembly protein [Falsirhodobacter sp. 20TX0035]
MTVLLFTLLPLAVLAAYLLAARRDGGWSAGRSASFAAGILLIVVAMLPSVQHWAHHDLRGHMIQHLMLGMFAPLALMLGAPGTLLLRSVSVGAARRLVALLALPPVRVLIHPITAALLDIGAMYVLYLTPLYGVMAHDPVLHVLLHVHFVLAGYLFSWSIAGPDPAPYRPGLRMRLTVLFAATAAHAVLGKVMYGFAYPRNTGVPIEGLRSAAQWMYYGGDLAEACLAVAFFAIWFRQRHRNAAGLVPA